MNLGSESETVEFKKSTGEHKEAPQAMSAMLNKHGAGELYFGVKDDGEVIEQAATGLLAENAEIGKRPHLRR